MRVCQGLYKSKCQGRPDHVKITVRQCLGRQGYPLHRHAIPHIDTLLPPCEHLGQVVAGDIPRNWGSNLRGAILRLRQHDAGRLLGISFVLLPPPALFSGPHRPEDPLVRRNRLQGQALLPGEVVGKLFFTILPFWTSKYIYTHPDPHDHHKQSCMVSLLR
jgi:hypothetical protein